MIQGFTRTSMDIHVNGPRCMRKFVVYAYVHVEFCSISHPKCCFLFLSLYADSIENEVPILHFNGYPWISTYNSEAMFHR